MGSQQVVTCCRLLGGLKLSCPHEYYLTVSSRLPLCHLPPCRASLLLPLPPAGCSLQLPPGSVPTGHPFPQPLHGALILVQSSHLAHRPSEGTPLTPHPPLLTTPLAVAPAAPSQPPSLPFLHTLFSIFLPTLELPVPLLALSPKRGLLSNIQ